MPEAHSPLVLLRGEAGLGAPRPSAPRPQPCPRASSATQHRGPVTPTAQNELLGAAFCKVNLCWGSKPQPQRASAQESNAIRFRSWPSPLHRANLSWAAPGSLGPAALLGVSGTRITLPTGSPSWGSRIGRGKAFCAQTTAMLPEPAGPLSAEAPSQRRHKTSFWELNSSMGNNLWAGNHSPNSPPLRKATLSVFAPGTPLSIGRS